MANYRVSTNTNNSNKTTQNKTKKKHQKQVKRDKNGPGKAFELKHDLLKISVDLQTAFAADTHLAEGQWLKEQLNMVKLRMFRVGTRMPTVSRTEAVFSATKDIY
jgi:hypothetical protein